MYKIYYYTTYLIFFFVDLSKTTLQYNSNNKVSLENSRVKHNFFGDIYLIAVLHAFRS